MPMPLGEYIRNRRTLLGLTQKQLAERMQSITENMISRWESGAAHKFPDQSEIRELADALECSVVDILEATGYIDPEQRPAPGKIRVYTWLENINDLDLPESDREYIRDMVTLMIRRLEDQKQSNSDET